MDIHKLTSKFKETFSQNPQLFRAPGRVNIIGEHTDYNDGLVLPFPIEQAIYFAASIREDDEIHIHALDLMDSSILNPEKLEKEKTWTRYFTSSLKVLKEDKHLFGGFNLMFYGEIPQGAGISSSSALTCGFLYTIQQLFNLEYSKRDIVFLASRAENGTGLNGGKMDQFSICMGEEGKAILLDCKNYSFEQINNNTKGATWCLFNTNVAHNLAQTAYNERIAEGEAAFKIIQQNHPTVTSYRDLTIDILNENIDLYSTKQYNRLKHYIEENERVLKMVKELRVNNLENAGQLLYESHHSLSKLYEVSCDELDFIVENLKNQVRCYGARMMGGGFGGSVIALIDDNNHNFSKLEEVYKKKFDLDMQIIPVISRNGINKL